MEDVFVTRQAKQRASIKWLLSKYFNNRIPENLKEPFYRDHENQEHLKPQITGALANAEIYCFALGNIYSDPNYHNLNHWSILQTLTRKGVTINEPSDAQLTETTLIQTNPLKMSAHMAVIEAIMTLYAKEVVSPDRMQAAIQRLSHDKNITTPENYEKGIILWISHACEALHKKILQATTINTGEGDGLKPPSFPAIKGFEDLWDGVGLAALVSLYCPDEVPWTQIKVSSVPTVQDSLHNLRLLEDFCYNCLPVSIFHLNPEDLTYLTESLKLNVAVFLADLFNFLEIHPANCVRYSGNEKLTEEFPPRNCHGVVHKRNLLQKVSLPIPDLRSGLDDCSDFTAFQASRPMSAQLPLRKSSSLLQSTTDMSMSQDSLRRASEDSFVVHRGKNIPTLRQVISDEPLVPARLKSSKEKQNNDSKADERGEPPDKKTAAGRPSNWEDSRKNTFAGRRSRRNSVSDDSQLTIENFGGSQDNLNFIGRNPDKEMTVHVGRKISAPSFPVPIENKAIRSSIQDAKGSIQLGYDNGFEKQDYETEKFLLKRQLSCDNIALQKFNSSNSINKDLIKDLVDGEVINRISFADFNKKEVVEPRTVQLVYMQHEKEDTIKNNFSNNTGSSVSSRPESNTVPQTTWQQQSNNQQQLESNGGNDIEMSGNVSVQLNDIRLKLEEKRRHIESEKRKIEMTMNKQRQKVGKAAFLQAVSKAKSNTNSDNQLELSSNFKEAPMSSENSKEFVSDNIEKPCTSTLQEISDDASLLERKWNNQDNYNDVSKASHVDHLEAEQYHHSLAQMNTSLRDLQSDIQRLASQQHQIQAAQQQSLLVEQQKQILALQSNHAAVSYSPHEHPVTPPLHTYSPIPSNPPAYVPPPQFFLHDQPQNLVTPQRRTWAQQPNPPVPSENLWNSHSSPGFVLHNNPNDRFAPDQGGSRYNNGDSSRDAKSFTLSQHHYQNQNSHPYGTSHSTPSASPQHRNTYRQLTAPLDDIRSSPVSLHQISSSPPARISTVTHAPIPAPSADVMEPQNISFIGNSDEPLNQGIMKLNITSGSRTYRIPSPTRPLLIRGAFPSTLPNLDNNPTLVKESTPSETEQKGFYISFDNEQPKRPKPPLRTKRGSPRKERSFVENDDVGNFDAKRQEKQLAERKLLLERELAEERRKKEMEERIRKEEERVRERQVVANKFETSHEKPATSAIIIGNELSNPDPDLVDERERKKERIMLLSLQRRQQQEEAKQRKEQETQIRREREKAKEDEKIRKKEEQAARRTAILEQYKLKKAIEEAEKEGKVLDRSDLMSLKATPKPRPKAASRPRPKTIHIDSGSIEMSGGMLVASKNRKGSTSNLTDITDDRGMSPCSNSNQTLGRRSSYKTSRDTSPAQTRGRSKFSTYQNLKGRKSSSLMNLYGSSTDQDSFMYRFGDTDSGLGRATPPKRIPSPGMGSLRHLNSPSGPGSLPGFMSKGRRMFDDGSSDISSTPSSMMDYTGPRLYKQPATKSNRGIMLNAVEYCVFPGVVNREAKRRVLDEINRSESKHFLILFRDAGCQFRALYSYCPEGEEVIKLYGTGPKQVNERMFDRFFKYNSGGKCFSQIHTKHLTVTIDAFTIHNSLWQGKKVNLPSKKDMTLVI